MKDLSHILDSLRSAGDQPTALATLMKTRGSSYRKPGARLLIKADGSTTGSISGGCVEQDIGKKALALPGGAEPQLVVFDMTNPDDELWGYGQGCNGVLYVLLERVSPMDPQFRLIEEVMRKRSPGIIATIFQTGGEVRARVGSRLLLFPGGTVQETILNPFVTSPVAEEAHRCLTGGSHCRSFQFTEGLIEVFFEVIQPPVSLTILGAGTDAIPLHRSAKELGWYVTVIDPRAAFATRDRFPLADSVIVKEPEALDGSLPADPRSAAVIMTHNFRHDLALLPALLRQSIPYVGLLGPKHRCELLLKRLKQNDVEFDSETLSRLHTPVGLNIGAETPEEIALAIVAEIQAQMSAVSASLTQSR
ncbi:MAG TPA: XdhC/CoxI family protein [Bacteroidota bacterium]